MYVAFILINTKYASSNVALVISMIRLYTSNFWVCDFIYTNKFATINQRSDLASVEPLSMRSEYTYIAKRICTRAERSILF